MSKPLDVLDTTSARAIETFCYTLAEEFRLTLDSVCWKHTIEDDHRQAPYGLMLTLTKPSKALRELWFTQDAVLGYAKGTTKAEVETTIHSDLEAYVRYAVEEDKEG